MKIGIATGLLFVGLLTVRLSAAGCGWILWTHSVLGPNDEGSFTPQDAYDTAVECKKEADARTANWKELNKQLLSQGKPMLIHSCYPSDFDPRPKVSK